MTEPLSGLALRRAVCEALGWQLTNLDNGEIYPAEWIPAYESDAKLSEALLDEKCREKGWIWHIKSCAIGEFDCWLLDLSTGIEVATASSKDPSEARMRALLMALRSQK